MLKLHGKPGNGRTERSGGVRIPGWKSFPAGAAVVISALLLLQLLSGCGPASAIADSALQESSSTAAHPVPERIISTAPSITETVFAVGAGDRLVGVTRFCRYPEQARLLPEVGGLLDPSGEAMIRLAPDLVITLEENGRIRQQAVGSGYRILAVDHKSIQGIIDSMETIGSACGKVEEGLRLAEELRGRLRRLEENRVERDHPPKVIISVGRNAGNGKLGNVYIAGNDNYYGEMIRLAGGVNAYSGGIRYPSVSTEGLLRMNPDVIIDLVPDYREQGMSEASLLADWDEVRGTRAFENGEIHVMGEDFWTLPGPRFIKIVEEMSLILN